MFKWLARVELNCPECRAQVTRGAFATNIYPKLNKETASQIKILEEKCNETGSQLKSFKEKCYKLENDVVFLEMENLSLKRS